MHSSRTGHSLQWSQACVRWGCSRTTHEADNLHASLVAMWHCCYVVSNDSSSEESPKVPVQEGSVVGTVDSPEESPSDKSSGAGPSCSLRISNLVWWSSSQSSYSTRDLASPVALPNAARTTSGSLLKRLEANLIASKCRPTAIMTSSLSSFSLSESLDMFFGSQSRKSGSLRRRSWCCISSAGAPASEATSSSSLSSLSLPYSSSAAMHRRYAS
mmetsp:Transcript_40968/g.96223  ORF Transcript_40968/g.96223 Transcript_40968/m.96223 type:complete len:215 (-) Transcript_40968:548-1192(-)